MFSILCNKFLPTRNSNSIRITDREINIETEEIKDTTPLRTTDKHKKKTAPVWREDHKSELLDGVEHKQFFRVFKSLSFLNVSFLCWNSTRLLICWWDKLLVFFLKRFFCFAFSVVLFSLCCWLSFGLSRRGGRWQWHSRGKSSGLSVGSERLSDDD